MLTASPAKESAAAKILVVDDERAIVEAVTWNLRQQGYATLTAEDADAALLLFRKEQPDLVILDVMLPSGSGFDVCRLLRQGGSGVPILLLTARIAEADRVQGLEGGADDYLTKPFGMRELIARVRALLRRSQAAPAPPAPPEEEPEEAAIYASAALELTVDPRRREVKKGETVIAFSRKEFDVLALMVRHPGRVFDRQTLLDRVWGEDAYVDDRTVDVHIRWLREKIEPVPGKPQHLLTVRGVGYKFQP